MSSLKDTLINNFIKNHDLASLVYLLNSNIIFIYQRKLIIRKILSDRNFILGVNGNMHIPINKYTRIFLTNYNMLINFNNIAVKNYVENMLHCGVFNEYDRSFLLYMLYKLLYLNVIDHSRYLYTINNEYVINVNNNDSTVYLYKEFFYTSDVAKIIGYLRIVEFSFNEDDYIQSWKNSLVNPHIDRRDNIITCKYGINADDGLLLEFIYRHRDVIKIIKLMDDYSFTIYDSFKNYIESHISGNIFKYNNNYHVGNFIKFYRMIRLENFDNITDDIILKNPYISSARENLNKILPFLEGDEDKIIETYNEVVIDGNVVRQNIYRGYNINIFSTFRIDEWVQEIKNLK